MKNLGTFVLCIAFILTSCGDGGLLITKDGYLKSFDNFVTEVEEKGEGYSTEDWEEKDELYKDYSRTQLDKWGEKMSDTELEKVSSYMNRYRAARAKAAAKGIIRDLEDAFFDLFKKKEK